MKRCALRLLAVVAAASLPLLATGAQAQSPRVLTSADYDRAAAQLQPSLNGLMVGGSVQAHWLPDDRFWYSTAGTNGVSAAQVILIDPANAPSLRLAEKVGYREYARTTYHGDPTILLERK